MSGNQKFVEEEARLLGDSEKEHMSKKVNFVESDPAPVCFAFCMLLSVLSLPISCFMAYVPCTLHVLLLAQINQ